LGAYPYIRRAFLTDAPVRILTPNQRADLASIWRQFRLHPGAHGVLAQDGSHLAERRRIEGKGPRMDELEQKDLDTDEPEPSGWMS
jgi:hypothetical protein